MKGRWRGHQVAHGLTWVDLADTSVWLGGWTDQTYPGFPLWDAGADRARQEGRGVGRKLAELKRLALVDDDEIQMI